MDLSGVELHLCKFSSLSPVTIHWLCTRVCVFVRNYPVLSQCVVAGGLLYERPVVLQTGLT